jgi:hypothetical protein
MVLFWGGFSALTPLASFAAGTVTLAWDPSPGSDVITNYNLYYGTASATYTNVVAAGTNLTVTISNLVEGASYYFAATAVDTNGLESAYSTEVSTLITNPPPTLNALANVTLNENAGLQTVNLSGITSGATNQTQTLTVTASSSNPSLIPTPAVNYTSPNTTGSITFTPVASALGSATITVTVNNGGTSNNLVSRTFTVTVNPVNQPPTLNALANVTLNENAGLQTVNLSGITSGATNQTQTLTVTASSSNPSLIPTPAVSYTSPNTTGSITFTPVASAYGSATVTVTVNNGGASNNIVFRTFTVTVNPANQPPTLNALANVTLNENAGLQTVNLSGITSGATNQTQTLTVTASSSNPSLIPTPAVSYTSPNTTGSITFTPVASAYGSATVTVTVNNGTASNNLVSQTFTVTVNPVNQPPTLNALANVTLNENAGLQTVNLSGITSGATNQTQTLTVTASSSNTGLIPTPAVSYTSPNTTGSITFTPVASAYGSATVTVTVNNGAASNNLVSRTFTVTVNPVNQPPTLNALANVTLNENAGLQTVNLSGITSGATNQTQTLTVTASSSNPSLIPTPAVSYTSPNATGSITFTPVASAYGSATITVTVNNGAASNNLVSQTFTVTVNPVNQPPTLNALANVILNENAGLQTVNLSGITSGATNQTQTLTITASSSNTGLIPTPAVSYTSPNTTGSITFTPVASAYGSATITVSVNNGGASNNLVSRTFTVAVTPVNQPPTLNALANLTLNENAGLQTVNLSGITSGATNQTQTLTVTTSSSNPGLIPTPAVNYTSPNTTGSITFTPVASAYGSATITVSVNNGGASNNLVSQIFTVTVVQLSSRPTTCTYALSMSPTGFTANAASGIFSVNTDSNCVWSLVAPSWVSLSSTNGTGAYAGTFTVEANTGLSRTGLVTVLGGETDISCTLTQQALVMGAVALVTPLDGATLQNPRPQFSWTQSDPAATNYYLWINCGGSNYLAQWSEGATNWTAPTDLPAGTYTWAVEAWNSGGEGSWSTNSTFTIQTTVPATIALLSPAGIVAVNGSQIFTWVADPAATSYELYIEMDGSLFLDQSFTLADSVVDSSTGDFAVNLSGVGSGTYQWWVRGWSPAGYGPWSNSLTASLYLAP